MTGHGGPILDLSFSPFHEDILATGSEDTTMKLWKIPNEITNSLITNQPTADLKQHTKKVMLLNWNPTVEFTIASSGMDGNIKIWDINT